ncbi:unnamed protein product [Heligmosomoides polygyrus]|uniref:Uncharacterized protein n=1 Tax=Heligmosomoides polygyrus TaxID=6339 RepID=A0A183GVN8_HELPZ|nr:unnamed protein product [Heligmosomoides polygyrus]
MMLFVSLERGGSIGDLWHATGANGDAAGARSSKSMINGTTGDTGEEETSEGDPGFGRHIKWGDSKCVVYETTEELTFDDDEVVDEPDIW